jgi:hypothetical protein
MGGGTEAIAIEYVEFSEERIVFTVHPKMTIPKLRRVISFATHVLTWELAPADGGTRLTLVIVEQDPPWWQRLLDVLGHKSW